MKGTRLVSFHQWIVGPFRVGGAVPHLAPDYEVECHRGTRGPYTGAGNLLRALMPAAHRVAPDLVKTHLLEILSAAPELEELIGSAPETLTSVAQPGEQTRIYALARTRRLAHGLVEFLDACAPRLGSGPLTLVFDNVDEADQTDQEFLSILLRRSRGGAIRTFIATGPDPDRLSDGLVAALRKHAVRIDADPVPAEAQPSAPRTDEELLRAFVDADGASRDEAEHAAYQAADPAVRAALHDARAAWLRAHGDWSHGLGAIPYHLEHGSDPRSAGPALLAACNYGISMGYYHCVLELSARGVALTDPVATPEQYWLMRTKGSTAMAITGRVDEAEEVYADLRSRYALPLVHRFSGYALAMIYTRMRPPERRDHRIAKIHMNSAIALATLDPDPVERAFNTVFHQNGLALVEMHLGNLGEALRLVSEGLARLDRELTPDQHRLHRSVLVHNKARLHDALGELEQAVADYSTVIELDLNFPDYYFDRADARRRLGDAEGAMSDYEAAMAITAPFWELHYNRSNLRDELGDTAGAIADLEYVLELEPDLLDPRVNLASLYQESDDVAAAERHVEAGLGMHPRDARLLCLRGQLALAKGLTEQARADFSLALESDADLVAALCGRAEVAYGAGQYAESISDLTRGVEAARDEPELLAELLERRSRCHAELGDAAAAARDLADAAAVGGAP